VPQGEHTFLKATGTTSPRIVSIQRTPRWIELIPVARANALTNADGSIAFQRMKGESRAAPLEFHGGEWQQPLADAIENR